MSNYLQASLILIFLSLALFINNLLLEALLFIIPVVFILWGLYLRRGKPIKRPFLILLKYSRTDLLKLVLVGLLILIFSFQILYTQNQVTSNFHRQLNPEYFPAGHFFTENIIQDQISGLQINSTKELMKLQPQNKYNIQDPNYGSISLYSLDFLVLRAPNAILNLTKPLKLQNTDTYISKLQTSLSVILIDPAQFFELTGSNLEGTQARILRLGRDRYADNLGLFLSNNSKVKVSGVQAIKNSQEFTFPYNTTELNGTSLHRLINSILTPVGINPGQVIFTSIDDFQKILGTRRLGDYFTKFKQVSRMYFNLSTSFYKITNSKTFKSQTTDFLKFLGNTLLDAPLLRVLNKQNEIQNKVQTLNSTVTIILYIIFAAVYLIYQSNFEESKRQFLAFFTNKGHSINQLNSLLDLLTLGVFLLPIYVISVIIALFTGLQIQDSISYKSIFSYYFLLLVLINLATFFNHKRSGLKTFRERLNQKFPFQMLSILTVLSSTIVGFFLTISSQEILILNLSTLEYLLLIVILSLLLLMLYGFVVYKLLLSLILIPRKYNPNSRIGKVYPFARYSQNSPNLIRVIMFLLILFCLFSAITISNTGIQNSISTRDLYSLGADISIHGLNLNTSLAYPMLDNISNVQNSMLLNYLYFKDYELGKSQSYTGGYILGIDVQRYIQSIRYNSRLNTGSWTSDLNILKKLSEHSNNILMVNNFQYLNYYSSRKEIQIKNTDPFGANYFSLKINQLYTTNSFFGINSFITELGIEKSTIFVMSLENLQTLSKQFLLVTNNIYKVLLSNPGDAERTVDRINNKFINMLDLKISSVPTIKSMNHPTFPEFPIFGYLNNILYIVIEMLIPLTLYLIIYTRSMNWQLKWAIHHNKFIRNKLVKQQIKWNLINFVMIFLLFGVIFTQLLLTVTLYTMVNTLLFNYLLQVIIAVFIGTGSFTLVFYISQTFGGQLYD